MDQNRIPWIFEREKSVLLVIDMQNDFLLEGALIEVPQAREILPRIEELIRICRETGVPVIYTVHMHHPDLVLNPLELKMWPDLEKGGLRQGSKEAQICEEIAPLPGEIIIKKRRFSAFYNTELDTVLRNIRGPNVVDTVIICGVVTNICCESTARDAFFRDYKVVFGSDINVAFAEDDHQATLRNIENVFGRVMDCTSVISALKTGKG